MREFAYALGNLAPTQNWCPEIRNFGHWERWERVEELIDPRISITKFPLQRGYSRSAVSGLFPFQNRLLARLKSKTDPYSTGLICTTPFYAPIAERWPGKVVYYQTDLTKRYAGMDERQIISLDRRLCRVATAVCPNSVRIAEYFAEETACDPRKITVIPNATREQNILDRPLWEPAMPPTDLTDLERPIVGVIGNLASNLDWVLMSRAVELTPDVSWAFVGPTDMGIPDLEQNQARSRLIGMKGRIRFLGRKSYSELAHYARCFDVALLPYLGKEPTYSGSATRFYEHLAACRPILATRGFHELLSKEPLLKLVDTGEEIATAVEDLRRNGFRDGFEEMRWQASKEGTWRVRARDLIAAAANGIVRA